jgi:predicted dehydrogenase
MSKTYTVGFIGCGKRALAHVKGLKADERCEVVAVADVNPEAAEALAAEFDPRPATFTDYRDLLDAGAPEMVIGCLWTPLHLPVFRACVEAGVRAYHSEKPMAPTWGECLEMGELAESKGCQLTFCHQRRFDAGNQAVRKLIAEGRIGEVVRMDLYSPKNLLDCGTHTIDQAMSFNGEQPAKWVLGAVDVSQTHEHFDVRFEDMAVGTIAFANGVRGHLQVGGTDLDMYTGVRVIGEKGFIEMPWQGQIARAVAYDEPGWQPPQIEENKEAVMVETIRHLVDCLDTRAESELGHRAALRATEVIFALYESVRRRARVELPIDIRDNPLLAIL